MKNGTGYESLHKLLVSICMRPLYDKYTQYAKVVTEATKEKQKV